jgi:hypothetical protein
MKDKRSFTAAQPPTPKMSVDPPPIIPIAPRVHAPGGGGGGTGGSALTVIVTSPAYCVSVTPAGGVSERFPEIQSPVTV